MWRKERVIIMAIPAYYSLLQRGSSGPDVALVQTWLNGVRDACTWYSELKADGKFGISTENAVKEFQLKNKMNVDGKVGANTWNVLYTRYTAKHGLHVPYPGIALRSGSSGGTVRLVQQKLNSLGERLNADGRFGAATAAAVQRFQRRNGLAADGSVHHSGGCKTAEQSKLFGFSADSVALTRLCRSCSFQHNVSDVARVVAFLDHCTQSLANYLASFSIHFQL